MTVPSPGERGRPLRSCRRWSALLSLILLLPVVPLAAGCSGSGGGGADGDGDLPDDRDVRIVSLDYALTETLLELGVRPVGVPDLEGYDRWVVDPELPSDVVDVGSTFEPNLELIQQLDPDLILTTPFLAGVRHRLERIAPTLSLAIYSPEGGGAYESAVEVTRRLGERLGRERAARELIARVDSSLEAVRDSLRPHRDTPIYLVRFMDPRHVRVFGEESLFDDVLERVDVPNAWQEETNYWGFSTVGIEALATRESVRLFYLSPPPRNVLPTLEESALWSSLPFVEAGRVHPFPMVLQFGGLPSAERFGRLLVERLTATAE